METETIVAITTVINALPLTLAKRSSVFDGIVMIEYVPVEKMNAFSLDLGRRLRFELS
jgi:hypothetical protein